MQRDFYYAGFDFSPMENMTYENPEEEIFRVDLLESVKNGKITPDDAEERAFDRGLDSLIAPAWRGPSVFEFQAWSIEMTLAWLIWGSKRAVQHFYTQHRIRCFEWQPHLNAGAIRGYERKSLNAASLLESVQELRVSWRGLSEGRQSDSLYFATNTERSNGLDTRHPPSP